MSGDPRSALSPELAAFIEGAVPSVWALEILLLLRRNTVSWAVDPIVAELRASPQLVSDCLTGLERAGLVARDDEPATSAPPSAILRDLADAPEPAYRERPVAVVKTITTRRSDPLKGFAESFRFRGWKS